MYILKIVLTNCNFPNVQHDYPQTIQTLTSSLLSTDLNGKNLLLNMLYTFITGHGEI